MPIIRSGSGRFVFSWRSVITNYTIAIWSLMTIVVLIVGRERLHILQTTKQFDEYIYAVMFAIYLTPHFWIPFVGWAVAPEVALYINSWGPFQVTGTDMYISFPFSALSVQCIFLTVEILSCHWNLSAISWLKVGHHDHLRLLLPGGHCLRSKSLVSDGWY